ncbi:MAG: 5-Nucleotidase domain protein [Paenibacillus sp.]|nr:5-Nucleotidase domain protein [Paenibacillus sp.]
MWTGSGTGELAVKLIARYDTGSGSTGAEIVQYDAKSKTAFVINGAEKSLDIVDLSSLKTSPQAAVPLNQTKRIKLETLNAQVAGIGDITSVAISPNGDYMALALPAAIKTDPGSVVMLKLDGTLISSVKVGALPDMVTFTPDGRTILAANEGEPNDEYTIDPEGSVSIIDVSAGADKVTQESVTHARFDNEAIIDTTIRKAKQGASLAQDFEPEYIAVTPDSKKAYVSLQEVNAVAELDLTAKAFSRVTSLGVKQHYKLGNGIDASDKDKKIHIQPWPVLGLYMPDGIDLMTANGKTYILTANEGDSRDYPGYSEEARVADLSDKLALKAKNYPGLSQNQLDELSKTIAGDAKLGRLKTMKPMGLSADGTYEAIYSYGARSFSIWDAETMTQVFDSGDQFEQTLAVQNPQWFNTSHDSNKFDDRSDDKGPEPEDVKIGRIGDQTYAFVGLERMGGIFAYNITDPAKPHFAAYFTSRDFFGGEKDIKGESGPEGLKFVPAEQSPTGKALLLAGNEISGTMGVYELTHGDKEQKKTITILHTNDTHGRVEESESDGMGFAKIAALVQKYERQNPNTLLLDAGDTFHGTNFATLVRGESIANVLNQTGYDAMAAGNHDFNYGYERLIELDNMVTFPILSANVHREADDSRILTPYVIKELDGIRLGIFGLTTPETTYKTHPNNVAGLKFIDPAVEAKPIVEELKKQQVDAIIAVTHLGIDESSTDTSIKLAKEVPGIDLIVDGHSHSTLVEGKTADNSTLIVSSGEYTKNLGVVELTFEGKALVGKHAQLISKDSAQLVAPDPDVAQTISKMKSEQDAVLSEVIGSTAVKLDGEREQVRVQETNLGNLITDAMLDATGADVALTNGGGIRASVQAGPITKGDIITVLPFGNYIQTKKVTGAELKAALEVGASAYPNSLGGFAHVGGMSFSIDDSKPAGSRVHSVLIKGRPLVPEQYYILATNDFLAAGGDQYVSLKAAQHVGDYPALDEALIAYIQKTGELPAAVEGRITIKAEPGSVKPEPTASSFQAPQQATASGRTYTVQPNDFLTAIANRYGTTWQRLQELNKLNNPNLIYPGQVIILP